MQAELTLSLLGLAKKTLYLCVLNRTLKALELLNLLGDNV